MDTASACYLGFTIALFLVFAGIVLRTLSPKRREEGEQAKYRMLDDD